MIEMEGESLMTQEEKKPTYGENIICLKMASPKKSMMFIIRTSMKLIFPHRYLIEELYQPWLLKSAKPDPNASLGWK